MKLTPIHTFEINDAEEKQFHRIVLLKSGTVVGLYLLNDSCYLQWFTGDKPVAIPVPFITDDVFAPPALFHFGQYAGVYSSANDFVVLFDENDKDNAIKISIENKLPAIQFPQFHKTLSNYKYAGNSDNNIIPFLFTNSGLLPVYIAHLQIDIPGATANWLNLQYWNNKTPIDLTNESFQKPENHLLFYIHY